MEIVLLAIIITLLFFVLFFKIIGWIMYLGLLFITTIFRFILLILSLFGISGEWAIVIAIIIFLIILFH